MFCISFVNVCLRGNEKKTQQAEVNTLLLDVKAVRALRGKGKAHMPSSVAMNHPLWLFHTDWCDHRGARWTPAKQMGHQRATGRGLTIPHRPV